MFVLRPEVSLYIPPRSSTRHKKRKILIGRLHSKGRQWRQREKKATTLFPPISRPKSSPAGRFRLGRDPKLRGRSSSGSASSEFPARYGAPRKGAPSLSSHKYWGATFFFLLPSHFLLAFLSSLKDVRGQREDRGINGKSAPPKRGRSQLKRHFLPSGMPDSPTTTKTKAKAKAKAPPFARRNSQIAPSLSPR